jgi:hypothetical protein
MMAAAHPTPGLTLIAPEAQFRMHAPHSMHAPLSAIDAFPPAMAKTACGQTSMHRPQPVHAAAENVSVSPFFK